MNQPPNPNAPKPWFRAKTYGYGAGLPIAWQGWVLWFGFLAVFLTLLRLFMRFMGDGSILALLPAAGMIGALLLFVRVSERRSDKDWQWRWGDDEK